MRWIRRFLAGLLVLLALAIAAVYFTPLDTYVPKVEQALSEQLREPVSIQHLRLGALPVPHIELQGVRLGRQEGIAARSISAEPDFPALLKGEIVVRRLLVRDGTASLAQVRKLAGALGGTSTVAQSVVIRELHLSGMNLLMPEATWGPIEGKLEFARAGGLERAWFAMDEQKVTAVLSPLPEQHFSLKAQARSWVPTQFPQFPLDELQVEGVLGERDFVAQEFSVALHGIRAAGSGKIEFSEDWRVEAALKQVDAPLAKLMALLDNPVELTGTLSAKGNFRSKAETLGALKNHFRFSGDVLIRNAKARISADLKHPLVFDQIKARVAAQPDNMELTALEARLYGGKLSGVANINRRNTMLAADVVVSGVAMQSLVEALTNEVLFTGSMDGAAKFSMRLDAFERFPENLQLTGNFHLRNGVLTKVDLLQAASGATKPGATKGATRFDDLTGLLTVDVSGYHFRKIKIASGSLNAEGKMDISPSLRLSGALDTNVKGTGGLISMPVVITGTLNDPVVRPSGSALAGAAVGTAILGPGLGTAIGAKIGGFLNKLFGKKNDGQNGNEQADLQPPAKK